MKLGRIVRQDSPGGVDFTALGENSLDTIAIGPGGWRSGGKQRLTRLVECPGGQAATAAVACARLGWRTRYAGAVGDDAAAAVVRAALITQGVEPVLVARTNAGTRRAVVLVDEASGDRTVLEYRETSLDLQPGEIAAEVFANARVLLVDGCDPPQSIHAARIARGADVRTIVDVDQAGAAVAELLRLIDVIVVPEALLEALAGVTGAGHALAAIGRETGAAAVVATLGREGALGWCRGHEVRAPGRAVAVVDTTGAGDAFRAGFAAGWLGRAGADPDLADLLDDGNLVARLSCRALGAQAGLPSKAEVPAHLRGGV